MIRGSCVVASLCWCSAAIIFVSTTTAFAPSLSSYSWSRLLPAGDVVRFRPQQTTATRQHDADALLVLFANNKNIQKLSSDEECSLDEDDIFACLAQQGYREDDTMQVQKIMVAELESLRDSFASFENEGVDEGSNMIKYNKRLRRSQQQHPILDTADETTEKDGESSETEIPNTHAANMEYSRLVSDRELVLLDTVRTPDLQSVSRAFHRAGPRQHLHYNPAAVRAAIVTCGGLCPGLNNVIRELTHSLYYLYGAHTVWGVTGGFNGFWGNKEGYDPIRLTLPMVENIHHEGGTVLRSSRGGFDLEKILQFLQDKKIDHLYVIGGDGTHRAAYKIAQECRERKMNVAVAGLPKTIDNDVDYIDRSFGFVSAVEAAQFSIRTAKTEAMCNVPNGIGIIKLMGRSAGFLAAFAALGSGDADLVLVPEVPIVLEGPDGILPFLRQRLKEQKYAVVVVAEGAGEELLGESTEKDAGGNKKLPAIGEYIRDRIEWYFAGNNEECTVKYIDPSYTVRSCPANAQDALYCMTLAQNAVHGAMAGYTGFTTGLINNRVVYLPIPLLVATSPRSLAVHGQVWERVLAMTGQPNTAEPRREKEKEAAEEDNAIEFPALPEPTMH